MMKNFKFFMHRHAVHSICVLLCCLFYRATNGQEMCITPEAPIDPVLENQIKNAVSESEYMLRIYIHRVRPSNGIGGLTDSEIHEVVEILHDDFQEHGIFFLWDCEIDNIDSDTYYHNPNNLLFFENDHPDGIDIYLMGADSETNRGKAFGIGVNSALYVTGKFVWGEPEVGLAVSSVVSHEMGHVLNLYHTFRSSPCLEFVNGSNCEDCGDLVCDTPAEPDQGEPGSANYPQCEFLFDGNEYDPNNDPYDPDMHIIMAYGNVSCLDYFTLGQGERMRNSIETLAFLQDCVVEQGDTEFLSGSNVINTEIYWNEDVIVGNGASLTIENCKVSIAEGVTIVVEPNAELIIDNATLTSMGCSENFWKGVELWGTTGATQTKVSGYRPQGYLKIRNGGVIENAMIGVTNWKTDDYNAIGGVIDVRDGEFINNYIAVDFYPHQNVHHTTGNPMSNLSKFKATKFEVNDAYIGNLETDWPEAQAKLWGVDGVLFSGCEFLNTSTVSSSEKRSKGIFSVDALYRVQPACASIPSVISGCPQQDVIPSVIDGFYRGIEASKATDALPVLVRHTKFTNNMVGVELVNLDFSEVIKSEFEIGGHPHEATNLGPFQDHLGIYSNETRCFAIEENEFYKDTEAFWEEQNGVFVLQSEENSNNIYLNKFSDLEHGAIGYQVNRDEEGVIGLQFTCNEMTNNFKDFVVSRTTSLPNSDDSGIRNFQGNLNPALAAGNSFSVPNGVTNEYTHWDISSDWDYHYYYAQGQAPDPNELTPNKIDPIQVQNENYCLTNYSTGGHKPAGGIGGVLQEYNEKKSEFYSLLYTYKQVIDEGDTEGTIDEIIATWPQDAWDLYDMLMARSPFNSDSVLIAAADREIMPHAMLLEVLLANPDALRSGRVIDHVENNLNNPMPGYMIDILNAATSQTTLRTMMENALSYHHAEMTRNYNFIIQLYTTDTLNGVHNDSLLYYLEQMDSPTGKYNLAGRLLRVGENTTALNIIDSIPYNYKLSGSQHDEWKAMQAFFNLLDDADRNGRNIASLDSAELVQLESIALDADGGIGALRARKALCFFYQHCISGPALPKSMSAGNKKPLPPLKELLADLDKVSAFPNPAKDYITFSYSFFREQAPNRLLRVFNQNGALIQTFDFGKAQKGQQLWDTRQVTPGIYLYDVYEGERKVHSGKVVIQ